MSTAIVYGRLQFKKGGKIAGVFTVPQGDDTFLILAYFDKNKWKPYWSAKTATSQLDDEYDALLSQLSTNLARFFNELEALSNVNNEVTDIVRLL